MENLIIQTISNSSYLKAGFTSSGYSFYFDCTDYLNHSEYGIILWNIKSGEEIARIPFKAENRFGNLFSCVLNGFDASKMAYAFYCDEVIVTDIRAEKYIDIPEYGYFDKAEYLKAGFSSEYDWGDDKCPNIPYEKAFIYLLHTRGFTKSSTSGTKYKGTFRGVADKLDYLKNLGVTTIEFQPVNEFNECDKKTKRLNYWGYCGGLYYSPKSAYSYSKDPQSEFSDMVKAVHNKGMEVVLQMFFPVDFNAAEIPSILEFWATRYHVDGFHLMGENISLNMIDNSPVLKNVKIFADNIYGVKDISAVHTVTKPFVKRYATVRDEYLYNLRRFLKADENSLCDAVKAMRNNPDGNAVINYFSTFNSFTLFDMVSYDHKHNEANGEDNTDGNDFNCSWNCGEEGPSKKQAIIKLRKKQIKNALTLLLLSSGTPMIYMGDEFGDSRMGNNNPYCIDDQSSWLDWKGLNKQFNMTELIQTLLKLRKEKQIFESAKELSMLDVSGCGFPEISYHGESAWKAQLEGYRHNIGVMYCDNGQLLYAGINMHWEKEYLSLPRAPKGCEWELIMASDDKVSIDEDLRISVPERSIVIYKTVKRL